MRLDDVITGLMFQLARGAKLDIYIKHIYYANYCIVRHWNASFFLDPWLPMPPLARRRINEDEETRFPCRTNCALGLFYRDYPTGSEQEFTRGRGQRRMGRCGDVGDVDLRQAEFIESRN